MAKRGSQSEDAATPLGLALRNDAADAAAHLHQAFDHAVADGRAGTVQGLACRAGCRHCCFGFVAVRAVEVFRLARAIRSRAETGAAIMRRVSATDRVTRGRSIEQRARDHVACPLLGPDGTCEAYDDRPLACRVFVSFDVGACKRLFSGFGQSVPVPAGRTEAGAATLSEFDRASRSAGRDHRPHELVAALAIALGETQAEERWMRGEDLLAPARTQPQSLGNSAATVKA